jgi:hypothetical protein
MVIGGAAGLLRMPTGRKAQFTVNDQYVKKCGNRLADEGLCANNLLPSILFHNGISCYLVHLCLIRVRPRQPDDTTGTVNDHGRHHSKYKAADFAMSRDSPAASRRLWLGRL